MSSFSIKRSYLHEYFTIDVDREQRTPDRRPSALPARNRAMPPRSAALRPSVSASPPALLVFGILIFFLHLRSYRSAKYVSRSSFDTRLNSSEYDSPPRISSFKFITYFLHESKMLTWPETQQSAIVPLCTKNQSPSHSKQLF